MACLPEPTRAAAAVNGRRLFELLQEPQEPFFLDVYLLEKGCSDSRLLPTTRSACVICCPGEASKRLQRLTGRHCRTWRQFLLKNILNWAVRPPPYNGTAVSSSESKGRGRVDRALHDPKHRIMSAPVIVLLDMEEKQSKLGIQVPVKAVSLFNELLDLAYTPAFYQLLGLTVTRLTECEKKAEEKTSSSDHEIKTTEKRQIDRAADRIEQLTVSELNSSMVEWGQFQQLQIREIVIEIEAAVFEDIKEETVQIMLSSHSTFNRRK